MAHFGQFLAVLVGLVYFVEFAHAGDTPIYPIPVECPQQEDENSIVVHLAHESDCEKFYTCEHGNKTEQICPLRDNEEGRLHFNPVLQVCDWPDNAGCQNSGNNSPNPSSSKPSSPRPSSAKPTPKPSPPSSPPASSSSPRPVTSPNPKGCPPEYGPNDTAVHLPHESDCEKFYICDHGNKVERLCPLRNDQGDRLHFNPVLQVCDFPDNAGCQNGGNNSPKPPQPSSSARPSSPKPTSKPSSPKPSSPKPSSAKPTPPSSSPASSSSPSPNPNGCPPEYGPNDTAVHLPHESDCEKFYICDHGNKVEQLCPLRNDQGDRLHFNPVLQVCDWPENAGCQNSGNNPSTPPNNSSSSSSSPASPSTPVPNPSTAKPPVTPDENNRKNCTQGPQPHECECQKYYECEDGVLVLYECPAGEWFDIVSSSCKLEWDAECPHKPTPAKPCSDCIIEARYLALPGRPNDYVWCNGSVPIVAKCPRNLVFNKSSRICDWNP